MDMNIAIIFFSGFALGAVVGAIGIYSMARQFVRQAVLQKTSELDAQFEKYRKVLADRIAGKD
jgi:hypothetical protein